MIICLAVTKPLVIHVSLNSLEVFVLLENRQEIHDNENIITQVSARKYVSKNT